MLYSERRPWKCISETETTAISPAARLLSNRPAMERLLRKSGWMVEVRNDVAWLDDEAVAVRRQQGKACVRIGCSHVAVLEPQNPWPQS
jgi:hypothetical protein